MATPLASLLGVKETVRLKAPHNPTLESYYCNITKTPTQVDPLTLTVQKQSTVQRVLQQILKCDLFCAGLSLQ